MKLAHSEKMVYQQNAKTVIKKRRCQNDLQSEDKSKIKSHFYNFFHIFKICSILMVQLKILDLENSHTFFCKVYS